MDFITEKRKIKLMFEHEHPLNLIDLWSEQLQREEESDEDEEENDEVLIAKQDFKCLCVRCGEEINWLYRYYYSCCQCSDYFVHKFCADFPEKLEDICEVGHTLNFYLLDVQWQCDICRGYRKSSDRCFYCSSCDFSVDLDCVIKRQQNNIIYHPSHKHPLVRIPKQILDECDACGKEHKGTFYHCPMCYISNFIHSHCAFLPKMLQIQHTTNDIFSHVHHLTLAYSFSKEDQLSKNEPRCRVCLKFFENPNLWIYKCEKCRYYTHLDCATSRNEPFMSILKSPGTGKTSKNYEDDEHLDLLHLPFPDSSYSILKHLFFKEKGLSTLEISNKITYKAIHQHPIILEDITVPTSTRIKSISYHDPMKRIELLCDGCLRPIMSGPIYMCAYGEKEHCNFVLHEWCSRLPTELKKHPHHPQHTLILHPKTPNKFFGIFICYICKLLCNGFVYYCEECEYHIDVKCAFLPEEITHASHPNHLLSRVYYTGIHNCSMCWGDLDGLIFSCHTCDDFRLHFNCALLIPETTTHKCDKHPMKLSYFPIENHKSEYICEICEKTFDPEFSFYHCRECMQSMHPACAPSILRYETYTSGFFHSNAIYKFVNVKFGFTYNNSIVHPHPLSFVQGIENDGECASHDCDYKDLQQRLIFKCVNCKFGLHYECCKRMSS